MVDQHSKTEISSSNPPQTINDYDNRNSSAWFVSFAAAMVPFTAFCYGHQKGVTGRVLESMVKRPGGIYGIFALPFLTLGMEKCIYDTVQSFQGINPNIRPADRGGFPSGGANLPSFSLVHVQKTNRVEDFLDSFQLSTPETKNNDKKVDKEIGRSTG
mmetsp:Transcript_30944/g.36101  ORF Transcript_30944/g.36101 Transcript_30944/m.36101 type:complete len:158 (+) Transcript_30944:59-532(+)